MSRRARLFRSRSIAKVRSTPVADLNLTSLTDMFAFLVTFLLKTVSVSTLEIKPPPTLHLPLSSSGDLPHRYVAIDIQEDGIFVEQKLVQQMQQFQFEPNVASQNTLFVLRNLLKSKVEAGEIESTIAIIRADKNTPFDVVWKVMYTARQLGFEEFQNLAVQRAEKS